MSPDLSTETVLERMNRMKAEREAAGAQPPDAPQPASADTPPTTEPDSTGEDTTPAPRRAGKPRRKTASSSSPTPLPPTPGNEPPSPAEAAPTSAGETDTGGEDPTAETAQPAPPAKDGRPQVRWTVLVDPDVYLAVGQLRLMQGLSRTKALELAWVQRHHHSQSLADLMRSSRVRLTDDDEYPIYAPATNTGKRQMPVTPAQVLADEIDAAVAALHPELDDELGVREVNRSNLINLLLRRHYTH